MIEPRVDMQSLSHGHIEPLLPDLRRRAVERLLVAVTALLTVIVVVFAWAIVS